MAIFARLLFLVTKVNFGAGFMEPAQSSWYGL